MLDRQREGSRPLQKPPLASLDPHSLTDKLMSIVENCRPHKPLLAKASRRRQVLKNPVAGGLLNGENPDESSTITPQTIFATENKTDEGKNALGNWTGTC